MSTRSLIWLEVKEEDKGKTFRPNLSLVGKPVGCVDDVTDDRREMTETDIAEIPSLVTDKKYVGIYHHWDGYPEGVGEVLVNEFNTYEKVLNLMTFGDESSICGERITPYCVRSGSYNGRHGSGAMKRDSDLLDSLRNCTHINYIYLFRDGQWYVFNDDFSGMTLVKTCLENIRKGA